jgi:hypothetical protein
MKLSNYTELDCPEYNSFTAGDTVLCYNSEVSNKPEIVEGVFQDQVVLQNYDTSVHYKTCRKLVRKQPKVLWLEMSGNKYTGSIFKEYITGIYPEYTYIKVIEVLEND